MIRGTTPTFTLTIRDENVDLSEATNVYVTFVQGSRVYEKTGDDITIDGRTVSVWLNQQESLDLSEDSTMSVQINWTYLDVNDTVRRAATIPKCVKITKQLLKRVIE